MTQITMLENRRGCEDGFTVRRYEEGKTYDVADMQARAFVGNGHAVLALDPEAQMIEASKATLNEGEIPVFNVEKLKIDPQRRYTPQEAIELFFGPVPSRKDENGVLHLDMQTILKGN